MQKADRNNSKNNNLQVPANPKKLVYRRMVEDVLEVHPPVCVLGLVLLCAQKRKQGIDHVKF